MGVEISDVRIFKVLGTGKKVKAIASITLGGEFAVHGMRVMEREDGTLWVSMPRQRTGDGSWRDVFHPVTGEAREKLINAVLQAYSGEEE
jgi:stage V sporulation protein G